VIQWATGRLGKIAIRHFAENPLYDLVACYVSDPDKVGQDAGEIAGIGPVGVAATDDVDAVVSTLADCVYYSPARSDVGTICRLLRSGKDVVTSTSFFYPTADFHEAYDAISAACRDGGTSFYGSGIHPGFAGDLLPLVLSRIVSRVDKIQVFEFVNFLDGDTNPLYHLEPMGFGISPDEFHSRPNMLSGAVAIFAQSMAMIAEGLGKHIEKVTTNDSLALAARDITLPGAVIEAGTVAAQHHEWTGWFDGKPLVVFHAYYTIGNEGIEPDWNCGRTRYRVLIEGDPSTELTLEGAKLPDQDLPHPGYIWTAMAGVNAIPAVCDASPGVVSHQDLGLVTASASAGGRAHG
jgi:hypothetical protein